MNGRFKFTGKPPYKAMLTNLNTLKPRFGLYQFYVNKRYVKSWIKEDGGYLLLHDQTPIPVSRQQRETVREEFERPK